MLHNSGETGEPCGAPVTDSVTTPPSSTPALSHARMSFSILRSDTRRSTWETMASNAREPKQSEISASSTQAAPELTVVRTASNAW